MLNLKSAVVPVTGAASGIGLAVCRQLRAQGATPLTLDLNQDGLQTAAREVFGDVGDPSRYAYVLDVSDGTAVDRCFADMLRNHGAATHAVANAGIVGLGGHGIRVNAVAPGATETPIQKHRTAEALQARAAFVPLGRLGQPDDIAKVVLFLLSDMAGYVSGHTLVVDGGLTAEYRG